jgi:type II secretory pathway pseudopilin PulG
VKKNDKGFTFIELVLYMGILSVFMVAVTTLIGSTVASNKKMTARKNIQTAASETYDAISDMLMGASNVMIYGNGCLETGSSKSTGVYIIPKDDYIKDTDGKLLSSGGVGAIAVSGAPGASCYDISDLKSYGDGSYTYSDDDTSLYSIVSDGNKLMLYIEYASGLDASYDTIKKACTLKYDKNKKVLYMYRVTKTSGTDPVFTDLGDSDEYILCKNVDNFSIQIDPDNDSFSIKLDLVDNKTAASYTVSGVVTLRNSHVLKKNEISSGTGSESI